MPRRNLVNDIRDLAGEAVLVYQSGVLFPGPQSNQRFIRNNRPPRRQINGIFNCYLDIFMQTKHDAVIRSYALSRGLKHRHLAGTQINHPRGTQPAAILGNGGYYHLRGQQVANVVRPFLTNIAADMEQQTSYDPEVQSVMQADNHYYDINYCYNHTTILILFHCYP